MSAALSTWMPYQSWHDSPEARAAAARRAAPVPAPPRVRRGGSETKGLFLGRALRFGAWMWPKIDSRDLRGSQVRYLAGSLDGSLRAIRAGRAHCRLLLDHDKDGPEFASTRDGSLQLWVDDEQWLCFGVIPRNRACKLVLAEAVRGGRRFASAGCAACRLAERGDAFDVTAATLEEISLVGHGACPDTFVKAFV